MLVLVFIRMLVVGVMVIIIGQTVADRTACSPAQSCADKTTSGTTDAIADHLTTRCAESPANGRLGLLAAFRRHGAPGRTAYPGADRRASAAPYSLPDNTSEGTADTSADCCVCGFTGESVMRYKKAKRNDRQ